MDFSESDRERPLSEGVTVSVLAHHTTRWLEAAGTFSCVSEARAQHHDSVVDYARGLFNLRADKGHRENFIYSSWLEVSSFQNMLYNLVVLLPLPNKDHQFLEITGHYLSRRRSNFRKLIKKCLSTTVTDDLTVALPTQ